MAVISIVGIGVTLVVLVGVVGIYLILRSLFAMTAHPSKVNIYVAKQKPSRSVKIANTPYRVETYESARLSTDLIDEEVIRAVKKNEKKDDYGKDNEKKI